MTRRSYHSSIILHGVHSQVHGLAGDPISKWCPNKPISLIAKTNDNSPPHPHKGETMINIKQHVGGVHLVHVCSYVRKRLICKHVLRTMILSENVLPLMSAHHHKLMAFFITSIDPNPRLYQALRGIKSLLRYPLISFYLRSTYVIITSIDPNPRLY